MSSATAATVAGAAFGYHRNLPLNAALGSNASSSFPWPKVGERNNLIQAPNLNCIYCGQHTEMNSDHVWYYCTGPLPMIQREARKREEEELQLAEGPLPLAPTTTAHSDDELLRVSTATTPTPLQKQTEDTDLVTHKGARLSLERLAAWAAMYRGPRSNSRDTKLFLNALSLWLRPCINTINDSLALPPPLVQTLARILQTEHLANCSPFTAPEVEPGAAITSVSFNEGLRPPANFTRGVEPPIGHRTMLCAHFTTTNRLEEHIAQLKHCQRNGHPSILILAFEHSKDSPEGNSIMSKLCRAEATRLLSIPAGHCPTGISNGWKQS